MCLVPGYVCILIAVNFLNIASFIRWEYPEWNDLLFFYYCRFLGFYTSHLVLPSIVGLVVFLFGLTTREKVDTPSEEICNELGKQTPCLMRS